MNTSKLALVAASVAGGSYLAYRAVGAQGLLTTHRAPPEQEAQVRTQRNIDGALAGVFFLGALAMATA